VLTAQPSLDAGQIQRKQMKLAMSVGTNRHYRIDGILRRHFEQTGAEAGLPKTLIRDSIEAMADRAEAALGQVERDLPTAFPEAIHASIKAAVRIRVGQLREH
jgi:serine/threonine-protein kinase HipA